MRVVGDDDVEQFEQVGHGAGVRDDHVHGRHERPVAADRDHSPAGRVGTQRVVRRRCPARGPGLLAEAERAEGRRRRRAGAVGGAGAVGAGEPVGAVRALGAAVHAALHAAVRHGRHVGQADEHGSARAQPLDGEGVALGDEVLEGGGAGRGGEPLGEVAVLRGVGDAVQRAERLAPRAACVGGLRLRAGGRVHHDHRVQSSGRTGPVVGVDPREIGVEQADRGRLALLQRRAQVGDTGLHDIESARHVGVSWVVRGTGGPSAVGETVHGRPSHSPSL